MRQLKRYFGTSLLLSAICAAQNPASVEHLYDQFTGPFLNSAKWLPIPTCSATPFVDTTASASVLDCARDIQNNSLHLMVRSLGNQFSDSGRQLGPSELFFVNPEAINTITVQESVTQALASACPANSTPFSSMAQTVVGGNYFNPGTGNPSDDVAAVLIVDHDPTTAAGVLMVSALVFSPDAFYGFASLGKAQFGQVLTETVQWNQPNHQFVFHAVGPNLNSTAIVDYAVSDTMPPAAPVKLLGARAFAPNCTTTRGRAQIEAFFDNVLIN